MLSILTTFFIISLVIIISFIVTDSLVAPYQWVSSAFSAITNLSYGYCASYFFYVLNIHLPQKKEIREKEAEIARCIAKAEINIKNFGELYNIPLEHQFHDEAVQALLVAPPRIFFHYGNFDLDNAYRAYIALAHVIQDTLILFHEALEHSSHLSSTDRLRLQNVIILISEQYRIASIDNFYAAVSSLKPKSLIYELHELNYRLSALRNKNKFAPHIFRQVDIIKYELEQQVATKQAAPSKDLRIALEKLEEDDKKRIQATYNHSSAAPIATASHNNLGSQQEKIEPDTANIPQELSMPNNQPDKLAPYLQPFKTMESYLVETIKGVNTSTKYAMRTLFIVSGGGCIALLLYISQEKGGTPQCVFDALRYLAYSTILTTALAGYNWLASAASSSILVKITTEMNSPDLKKNANRVTFMWVLSGISYVLWGAAFVLIIISAYQLLPQLNPSFFK
ncbi:hypothetical protein [Halodesulfovibrio aestuarii]|uniref:hypothetical protein n=1 Tax=Halodesulfovibrio aestuarii TaxID=126333 RepID=UPI0003F6639D